MKNKIVICLFLFLAKGIFAQIPAGYELFNDNVGVSIYKKTNEETYVQVINLSTGAKVIFSGGNRLENITNEDNPTIKNYSITDHWGKFSNSFSDAISICNGVQFDKDGDYTTVQYPARSPYWCSYGSIIGSSIPQNSPYCNDATLKMIEIHDKAATISNCNNTPDCAVNSKSENLIVHLSSCVPQKDIFKIGRNVIGLSNPNENGFGTIVIATSSGQTKAGILRVLSDWGVDDNNAVLLDASTASQLVVKGESLISTNRKVPNIIGVLKGKSKYELSLFSGVINPNTTSPGLSINTKCLLTLKGMRDYKEFDIYLGIYLSKNKEFDNDDIFLDYSIVKISDYYSAIFEKNVRLPGIIETGKWNVLFVPFCNEDLQKIIATHNTLHEEITIEESNHSSAPKKADLLISKSEIHQTGNTLEVVSQIANIGAISTQKNFLLKYYLSDNSGFEYTDMYLGYKNVAPLNEMANTNITKNFSLPDGILNRRYYLIAFIDATNEIDEICEENNINVVSFRNISIPSFSKPDLTIKSPSVISIAKAGGTISPACVVENQGTTSNTKSFTLQFLLSTDRIPDDNDIVLKTINGATLAPGFSVHRSADITLPAGLQGGAYYIIFDADIHNEITESNETNNYQSVQITIREQEPDFIDLHLEIAEIRPVIVKLGDTKTQVRTRVRNIGNSKSSGCQIEYYLSKNGSALDAEDQLLAADQIKPMYGGYTNITETEVTLPLLNEGQYYILFVLDQANTVSETNDANNYVARLFKVRDYVSAGEPGTYADLVFENMTLNTATAFPGSGVTATYNIKNIGDLGTIAASRVGYYISEDNLLDDSDELIASTYFGSILPGQSYPVERTFSLPSGLPQGTVYVLLLIDYQHKVQESEEGNNAYIKPLTISYSKEMTVFAPNNESAWSRARKHEITWASDLGGTVKIELYKGVAVKELINSSAPNTGSYIWDFPGDLYPKDDYRIKITSNSNSAKYDFSEYFEIVYEDFINVLEPLSNAEFGTGTSRIIKWKTAALGGVDNVDIELHKSGKFCQQIDNLVSVRKAAENIYEWNVNEDIEPGNDYTVKIVSSSDPATFGISPEFSIIEASQSTAFAIDDVTKTAKNTVIDVFVLQNDNLSSFPSVTIQSVTVPQNGAATISADKKSIKYQPDNDFVGTDVFSYTINPDGNNYTASVYVDMPENYVIPENWLTSSAGSGGVGNKIAIDKNGNAYIYGWQNNVDFGPVKLDGISAFIAKYNSKGICQWANKISGPSSELPGDIDVDNAGNIYITSDYGDLLNLYEGNTLKQTFEDFHGAEVFYAKYSPLGNIIWVKNAVGWFDDIAYGISVDKDNGDFCITGYFNDDITFGSGSSSTSLTVQDNSIHAFIAKFNTHAVPLWAKKAGSAQSSIGYGITFTHSKNVAITGWFDTETFFSGNPDIKITNNGDDYHFTAVFEGATGDVIWAQKSEGSNGNKGWALVSDNEDNIFTVGAFEELIGFYDGNTFRRSLQGKNSSWDIFIVKYSNSGIFQWAQHVGDIHHELSFDISLTNNNPVLIAYYNTLTTLGRGADEKVINSNGINDILVAELDNQTGRFVHSLSFGGPGGDVGKGIVAGPESEIYVTGSVSGEYEFNNGNSKIEVNTNGSSDAIMVAKLSFDSDETQIQEDFSPVVINDNGYTTINTGIQLDVLDNDSDLDGDELLIISALQPVHGQSVVSSDNKYIIYTPNAGYLGIDSFEYRITDGHNNLAKAKVTMFVVDINEAPVLTRIPDQTISIGATFQIISLNDFVYDDNTPSDKIQWSISSGSNLDTQLSSALCEIFSVSNEWTGTEQVIFVATDENGLSQSTSASFTIVKQQNEPPVFHHLSNRSVARGENFEPIVLDNHIIDDHTLKQNIEWSVNDGQKIHVTIQDNIAYISIQDDKWTGSEDILFFAKDEGGLISDHHVTFSVEETFFNVQITQNITEGGILTGNGAYVLGQTVSLKATPAEGYHFVNWTENDEVQSTEQTLSFIATADRKLTANFQLNNYDIQISALPDTGGTFSGSGTHQHGQKVELSATPQTGFSFVNWTENDQVQSTEQTLSFIAAADRNLTANFQLNNYDIEISALPDTGGTVSGSGTYQHGQKVELSATPQNGFTFVNWTENDQVQSTEQTLSFIATADRNLTANFQLNNYDIEIAALPDTRGMVSGSGTHQHGQKVELSATPQNGFTFVNWTENDEVQSTEQTWSFIAAADRNLTANFQLNNYDIQISALPDTGGTVSGSGIYQHGQNVELTATPQTGFTFVNWTENGEVQSTEQSFSFIATAERSLTANFSRKQYEIKVEMSPASAASIAGNGTYLHREMVHLSVEVANGFAFKHWEEEGEIVSLNNPYTFRADKNRNLVAVFDKKTFALIINTKPENSGTVTGSGFYEYGDTVLVAAIPFRGFSFLHWKDTQIIKSEDSSFQYIIDSDAEITAYFEQKSFTLETDHVPVGAGNTFGDGTYLFGDTAKIIAVSNKGYEFEGWEEEGETISTEQVFSFDVTKNLHLTASFIPQKYNVNANPIPAGAGKIYGTGDYEYGQTVSLTAIPSNNYIFSHWEENSNIIFKDSVFTFKANSNRFLDAVFNDISGSTNIFNTFAKTNISIFPNPFSESISISSNRNINCLKIFTIPGMLVFIENEIHINQPISLPNLKPGIYIVEIKAGDFVYRNKLYKY